MIARHIESEQNNHSRGDEFMKNLIPIALILLSMIVGCKLPATSSSNSSAPSNSASANTANSSTANKSPASSEDPRFSVSDALRKLRSVPFVTTKSERAEAGSSKTIEQYLAADERYTRRSESGEDSEHIKIGKDYFSRMNSNWPWKKETGSTDSATEAFYGRFDRITRALSEFSGAAGGDESIDGKAASVVTLTAIKQSSDMPTMMKFWIDKEKGVILKMLIEMGKDSTSTTTFDYTTPVKIERPALDKK